MSRLTMLLRSQKRNGVPFFGLTVWMQASTTVQRTCIQ